MENIKLKGVWIPTGILINDELADKEKIVLSIIVALITENKSCFMSNRYLSKILGITINRASKIVSSLKSKNYISVKVNLDDKKEVINREINITDKLKGMVKNNNRYGLEKQYPIVPKGNYIKYNYNKYYNKYSQRKYTREELEKLYKNK